MLFLLGLTTLLSIGSALPNSRSSFHSSTTNVDLRILPLGASITYGLRSSDGNGYRKDLRDLLSPIPVTYIGSQCSGNMTNGNNEGHPGYVISQMKAVATPDLAGKPNVVLIYVGTNDMLSEAASEAPENMLKLVSFLVQNLPNSLIVVSELFLNASPASQRRIVSFNRKISRVLSQGNVVIADLAATLSASDMSSDGTHPNDSGYSKMAKVFYTVLTNARQQGRIPTPEKITKQFKTCNGPETAKKAKATPTSSNDHTTTSAKNAQTTGKARCTAVTKATTRVM